MLSEIHAAIGPLRIDLRINEEVGLEWLRRHFRGFECEPTETRRPDVTLYLCDIMKEGLSTDFSIYERARRDANVREDGVKILARNGDPIEVFANYALDFRSVLRRVKRLRSRDVWLNGRRSLFLRHGLEHVFLSLLTVLYGYRGLHASAVARNGKAIIIVGDSGCGKTSLAIELCEGHGFEFIADNFVPCNGLNIAAFPGCAKVPSPGGVKTRSSVHCPTHVTLPLDRVVWLDGGRHAPGDWEHYLSNQEEDYITSGFFQWLCKLTGTTPQPAPDALVKKLAARPLIDYDVSVLTAADISEDLP